MTYQKPSTRGEKDAAREATQAITRELTDRIDARVERLAAQLAAGASTDLLTFMRFSARFHSYSLNNQLLIWLQAPTAKHVAGFHAWRALGRSVRKGARAVRILSPVLALDRDAAPLENGRRPQKLVGFRYASVFADYDTEGDPLPAAAFLVVQGGDEGTHELLRTLVSACPVRVEWEKGQGNTAHGWTDGSKIVLNSEKCASEPAHAVRVFFHEWAHVVLHFQGEGKRPGDLPDRQTRELEADACAYVLSSFHGIEAAPQVADYITTWGGNADRLRASLSRTQRAVSEILGALEPGAASVPQAAD